MSRQLDFLNSAQQHAGVVVGGASSFGVFLIGDTSSRDAYNTLLAQTNVAIGQLAGPEWLQVTTNQESYESWSSHAQSVYKTLTSVDADLGNWTFGGVVSSAANQTVSDIKQDATIGLAIATPLILLGVGLYLFLLFGLHR
jgi:hypothetical protein